jgi:ribosome-binding protein aMBF1 (putative translation factor)
MGDAVQTLVIDGREYVVLPKATYLRLAKAAKAEEQLVDAVQFSRESLGRKLRAARERASLTQAALAKKLKKSQAMISAAESGRSQVGEAYVRAVLRACKLPPDWKP